MSSKPHLRAEQPADTGSLPFASYAQLTRMLLPLTGKVCFYDAAGDALWISDGLEEPELRMRVQILLSRFARDRGTPSDASEDDGQPTFVFPIRDQSDAVAGALVIVFRDLPANTTYRRADTVERLLSPVIEVLTHAWRTEARCAAPTLAPSFVKDPLPELIDAIDRPAPLPALLRRTIALATHRLQCAFGALVVTDRSFTLTHRASPDESDLTVNAAIEAVRTPMLKLMRLRTDALVANNAAPGRERVVPFKLLVFPVRATPDRLAAMLMLFRNKRDPDFTGADVDELAHILARLPPRAFGELDARADAAKPQAPAMPPTSASVAPQSTPSTEPQIPATPLKIIVPPPHVPRPTGVPLIVTPDAGPTMEERIRAALRDDAFDLLVQRISPLRDEQRPARFEVLLRMQEANRLRPPASFFEAAEAGALMPELDRWVICRLLKTLREHAAVVRSKGWEFCINIAAQSLVADRFSDFVVAEVCKSSIPAGLLVFEISECDALEHQHALEFLGARLRDVGCRIALDNCRAGLATFGPLHKWPVSCVKIDGSLIRNVGTSTRSESVVRAVAQLAANMGIETVAERVENASLCDKLADIGMDYAQGFHFGQPEPLTGLFR